MSMRACPEAPALQMVKRGGLTEMGKLLLLIARERGEDAPAPAGAEANGQDPGQQPAEQAAGPPQEFPQDTEASLLGMFEAPQGLGPHAGHAEGGGQLPGAHSGAEGSAIGMLTLGPI